MKTGIYMIRNKVNDKKYIGQAVDIDFRWYTHINDLNDNKHRNPHLQSAWNKYGSDNFEFTIICLCEEEELDEFEIDMIAHFDTYNNGYNLTLGGGGTRGYKYTDEQRARCSERNKEVMNRPEIKAKLSEALKGDKNPMKRPEIRAKTGKAMKEIMNRPEVKKKRSEAMKGDKNPMNRPEVRAKHSEALKEYYKDPENRKKTSEATKEAMKRPEVKAKLSKKVYCVTNDTVYASVSEAGEKLGIDPGYIGWCCRGKYITKKYPDGHHIKGLEFWFLSEYEEKFGKVAM